VLRQGSWNYRMILWVYYSIIVKYFIKNKDRKIKKIFYTKQTPFKYIIQLQVHSINTFTYVYIMPLEILINEKGHNFLIDQTRKFSSLKNKKGWKRIMFLDSHPVLDT
jgi:hypothetical protein